MKKTALLALLPAAAITTVAFSSCSLLDPNYKAWKAQQAAAANTAATANPNSVPASGTNPYGVPQTSGEAGSYSPSTPATTSSVPYQPIPNVSQPITPSPAYTPSAPTAQEGSHTVAAGDSLWSLARKYGSSIEAIQSANSLNDTVIRTGQTLIIPGN